MLTGFPPGGIDVLEVTGGQDRGARFALHGASATLGRAPTVDVMLTDPEVAAEHARLTVAGGRLRVADLGTGATRVNGAPLRGSAPLSRGDRLLLGATELTVRWTPGAAPDARAGWPEAAPPPPPPSPPRPSVTAAPAAPPPPPPPPVGREALRLPAIALGLSVLAPLALWVPVLDDGPGSRSVWSLGSAALRALALLAALLAAASAAAWLAQAAGRRVAVPAGVALVGLAGAGGALFGVGLLLATADLGTGRRAGLPLLVAVALALAGVAAAGALGRADGAAPAGPEAAVVAAGAVTGGLLAAVAPFLSWLERGVVRLSGFDAGVLTARGLLPLALATVGAGIMAPVAASRLGRREGALAAAVACALGAAVAAFGVTAAAVFRPAALGPGVGLAVSGGVVALIPAAAGALALLARRRPV